MEDLATTRAVTVELPQAGNVSVQASATDRDGSVQALELRVPDIEGSYRIPYIQSDRTVRGRLRFREPRIVEAELSLDGLGASQRRTSATGPAFEFAFESVEPGEYTLHVRGTGVRNTRAAAEFRRLGVGVVVAAIGDSVTEGYYGHSYKVDDLDLTAGAFPSESVSKDGRNFPQFAPTTHAHLPDKNCFESWMTRLNDRLTATWHRPVFVANEGWGGITSAGYLKMMREDAGWKGRMEGLKPRIWLIHLGVNDERAKRPREDFANDMSAMVDTLIGRFGAASKRIFIAKPCYDYFEGAPEILASYGAAIDELVARRSLSAGADFYAAYATEKERWYGADPVHPNLVGMARMADLWHDAVVRSLPKGVEP